MMETTQILLFALAIEALVIIALVLVVFSQGKALGTAYPADVKQVLGALAGLAVFFSAKTSTPLDDTLVNSVLLPVFQLLGIDAPPTVTSPAPAPAPTGGTVTTTVTVDPPAPAGS